MGQAAKQQHALMQALTKATATRDHEARALALVRIQDFRSEARTQVRGTYWQRSALSKGEQPPPLLLPFFFCCDADAPHRRPPPPFGRGC